MSAAQSQRAGTTATSRVTASTRRGQQQAMQQHACRFWHRLRADELNRHHGVDRDWLSICLQKHYHCTPQSAREQVSWFLAYFGAPARGATRRSD